MSRYFAQCREPVSSYTHFWGAVASALGTVFLVGRCVRTGASGVVLAGAALFGLSLVALYSASSIYHAALCAAGRLRRLRKLDHAMIYVLIAGSYTPFALKFLPTAKGLRFCLILWGIALAGIVMKLLWINAPRLLTSALYLAMGWSIVFVLRDFASCGAACMALVALGGVSYTVGAVLYAVKRPNFSPEFGFHELFHLFILGGSLLHYLAVFFFVL